MPPFVTDVLWEAAESAGQECVVSVSVDEPPARLRALTG